MPVQGDTEVPPAALQNIQAGSATGFENNPQEIKHKVACYKPYAALVKS